MPAKECTRPDGSKGYKWGTRGACIYKTAREAEEDNKMDDIYNDFMDKKQLKRFINENGFFVHISDIETIDRNDFNPEKRVWKDSIRTDTVVPDRDSIIILKGRATQTFPKGKVSRNNYKIDLDAWDWDSYIKNPIVFLAHDSSKPIGNTIEIHKTKNGIDVFYWVDLNWLEEIDRNRVRDGAFAGLSTGHITRDFKFEDNKTGERFSVEELEKKGINLWDVYMSDEWSLVITGAEALEISQVTLPSNPDALTLRDSLEDFFTRKMKKLLNETTAAAPEVTPEDTKEDTPIAAPETTETAEETPEAEGEDTTESEPENGEPAPENGEEKTDSVSAKSQTAVSKDFVADLNKISADLKKVNESLDTMSELLGKKLVDAVLAMNERIAVLENAPTLKAIGPMPQNNKNDALKNSLYSALESAGVRL
jgi:hypothetical protein